MKTGNRDIFSTTSKVIGEQANWKRRASKGNELTKRILSVGGVKTQRQWQESLTTVASSYMPTGEEKVAIRATLRNIEEGLQKIKDTPLCSFEAKLMFKNYSITVKKMCEGKELVRFSFTLDTERGKIKMKVNKSRIVGAICAFVPPQVKTGTKFILNAMEHISIGKQANMIKVFTTILEVLTSTETKTGYNDMPENDVMYDEISLDEAVKLTPTHKCKELFSALSALDLKIRFSSKNIGVEIRRREFLAGITRKTVVLDAEKGLQFEEPHPIFKRAEVQSAVLALEAWVQTSCKDFSIRRLFSEVMKYC